MKRLLTILAVLTVMVSMTGCAGVRDIKVTSCAVKSISLSGLRSIDGVLTIGIENPIMAFTISDLSGVITHQGEEFATFKAGKLPVARKSSKIYPLSCSGSIARNVSLLELVRLAGNRDLSDMAMDLTLKVKLKCGISKTLKFKGLKVTELMGGTDVASACLDLIANEEMI